MNFRNGGALRRPRLPQSFRAREETRGGKEKRLCASSVVRVSFLGDCAVSLANRSVSRPRRISTASADTRQRLDQSYQSPFTAIGCSDHRNKRIRREIPEFKRFPKRCSATRSRRDFISLNLPFQFWHEEGAHSTQPFQKCYAILLKCL